MAAPRQCAQTRHSNAHHRLHERLWFEISNFDIVSDFDIRISDLRLEASCQGSSTPVVAQNFLLSGRSKRGPPGFPVRLAVQVPAQVSAQETKAVGAGQGAVLV